MTDLVLFVLPMLVMAAASVLTVHEFSIVPRLTVSSYMFFLASPLYLTILGRTVVIAFLVTLICLVAAFPFALFLTRLPPRVQKIALVCVILPFWTSYLLRVYAWMTILGQRGLINRALLDLGLIEDPLRFLLYSDYAVVIVTTYLYLPYAVLALYTALERLDPSLIKAAMDLGARPVQVFWNVLLPLSLPGVFASFIFVFIPMVGEYVTPNLVGGARGLLIMNVVVSQVQALRFGVGAAMAIVIVVIMLCLMLALSRVARLDKIYGA